MSKYYRVTHIPLERACSGIEKEAPLVVEGYANSPYHACKMAFRILTSQGYISQPPNFNKDLEGYPNTDVEIIQEPEHEPAE